MPADTAGSMVAILVTGMSGTGTSTALAELPRGPHRRAAHRARQHPTGGAAVRRRLRVEPATVLSQVRGVVLLSAPVEVLLERLATRTTTDFGMDPAGRDRILADLATVEPLLRAGANEEIDTRAPITEMADRLVRVARRAS
jgi:dephospho-CoA kinase